MGVLEQLRIEVKQEANRVVVSLEGELDMASAPLLQSAIASAEFDGAVTVVLDLQRLQFVDSTGLRVILALRRQCAESGRELAVTRGSQQVERVLAVTGVGDHLRTIEIAES